jgi:hypothetical protein
MSLDLKLSHVVLPASTLSVAGSPETPSRELALTLVDTPGHPDYLRNTLAGITQVGTREGGGGGTGGGDACRAVKCRQGWGWGRMSEKRFDGGGEAGPYEVCSARLTGRGLWAWVRTGGKPGL